ncbi:MAG TPA: TIGR00645 family protein [Methylomirabilota bacterium]|nr:TIGR00645 family protein [Methylomirabilota bacterium]
MNGAEGRNRTQQKTLGSFIFLSRWLQAPLYLGLIIAQGVYVFRFMMELWHLIAQATSLKETEVMLIVLGLIDVVMIANLLIMVIIGGYETFVSRLHLAGHPDQPEWLSHVNAGVLKVKLATALIGISSIHLLKTFIEVDRLKGDDGAYGAVFWQVMIHITFVLSALILAWIERLLMVKNGKGDH